MITILIRDIEKHENIALAKSFVEAKAIKTAYEEDNENAIVKCYVPNPYSNFMKDVTSLVDFHCCDSEF